MAPEGQKVGPDKKLNIIMVRTTFRSYDVKKIPVVVMRNSFQNQNLENISYSDFFKKYDIEKNIYRCIKSISKSEFIRYLNFEYF